MSKNTPPDDILGRTLEHLLDESADSDTDIQDHSIDEVVAGAEESDTPQPVPPRETVPTEVHIDDLEVLQAFVEESTEHMEQVEEKIVRLERDFTPALVNEVFRAMHTVKGTASFFGENVIAALSHRLESIFDGCRDQRIEMSGELADILLAGTDELARMIRELSEATAGVTADELPLTISLDPGRIDELTDRITSLEMANGCVDDDVAPTPVVLEEDGGTAPTATMPPGEVAVDGELYGTFVAESVDLLAEVENDMLALEKSPENTALVDRAFRHVHTIKGNAGFLGLDSVEELSSQIENVLDGLRSGDRAVSGAIVTAVLRSVDSLARFIRDPAGPQSDGTGASPDEPEEAYKPLGEILVDMGLADDETVERALDTQERKLGEILVSDGTLSADQVERALETQQKSRMRGAAQATSPVERHAVRVDVQKLDRLFELVGELIMAEAMVVSNPDLDGLVLERFNRSAGYLGKITRQMQEITMSVRMIPLEGLFNKMRRLVRDLSRKTKKEVDIDVTGQDTEMDRNVIEVLADPLVHMIRNCADHGIESEAERKEAGKDKTGHINLGARYEGSEIWITVRDDGRGLRRDSIVAKAVSRGLTTAEDAEKLSDAEVWDFLFQPGFSTKEQVTEVSGRGVGMDVVRRNIEQLRGRILVTTEPGSWTEFTLRIPLTLAIIDGVTTRVGNTLYAIPLNDIREFQQVLADGVRRTSTSGEVLDLREEIIPVVRLSRFFGTDTDGEPSGTEVFIVVQSGNGKAALLVDEIIGYSQIVVKSLPESLGNMEGLVGCTVLGNGDVSLIVDTNALVNMSRVQVA